MYSFKSTDSYTIHSRNLTVFCVENPHDCEDFSHLLQQIVEIDGKKCKVIGVERFLIYGTYRKGMQMRLAVDFNKE